MESDRPCSDGPLPDVTEIMVSHAVFQTPDSALIIPKRMQKTEVLSFECRNSKSLCIE